MAIDDRPTLAAPDDDPYLWLEEIEGERALDFVDRQSRLTLEAFGGRQFAADRDTLAAIYDRPTTFPMSRAAAGWSTISGRMPKIRAASGGARRLQSFATRSRPGRRCWTSTASPPRRTRTGCSAGRSRCRASSRAIVAPFARRQRRGDAAGIRSRHQGFRRRRLRPAGSQGRRRMARRRHAAAFERPWRGHGDDFRLCANRPAVAARRARGTRAGAVRSAGRPHGRVLQRRRHRRRRRGSGSSTGSTSSISISGSAPRPARAQSSICRPTSGWRRITTGSRSSCATPGRSAGKTYAPDTVLGISLSAFLAGDRNFTMLFEPARGGRCRASSGPPASWCCRSSTSCGRCSRSARRRQAAGRARDCRACPKSASSMSGGSTARSREQRRPARQCAGSADAAVADADRRRRQPRHA